MVYEQYYAMLYKYGKRTHIFGGIFIFILFKLVSYISGAFLMKQLFYLCLLDMG